MLTITMLALCLPQPVSRSREDHGIPPLIHAPTHTLPAFCPPQPVKIEDSSWSVEDNPAGGNRLITITLTKMNGMEW
jgi:hypothetical protein